MNVLVIGGTRFFGIPMVEKLLENGHQVTIATRGLTPDTFGDYVNRMTLDIYQPNSVKKALNGASYDVIIDKMGYGALDIKSILDNATCEHFIHMSTAGVYQLDHEKIIEDEFDPMKQEIQWLTRGQADYDTLKRMAEAAIVQNYSDVPFTIVRSPFVLGKLDYLKRIEFYVNCITEEVPMQIDNLHETFSVANAEELGRFIADCVSMKGLGCVNFCSEETLSVSQIIAIAEKKVGKRAIITETGEKAPLNGTISHSLSISKIQNSGFQPSNVSDWLEPLIDTYVKNRGNNIVWKM